MEAINQATGEVRQVLRERRGVAWWPFCDRRRLVATTGPFCDGCRCEFRDAVVEVQEEPATPRRRRQPSNSEGNGEVEAEATDSTTEESE